MTKKDKKKNDEKKGKAPKKGSISSELVFNNLLKDTPIPNTQGLFEGLAPEDVRILIDSFTNFKYGLNSNDIEGPELAQASMIDHNWIARDRGFSFKFNQDIEYPYRKPGLQAGCIVFEYPASVAIEGAERLAFIENKLREFESINIALKNENQRQLMYAWTEDDWLKIAEKYDPYKRDTKQLEKNLKKRKLIREKNIFQEKK